jgi:hypothetical protein
VKERLDQFAIEREHVAEPTVPLDEAREQNAARMKEFAAAALEWKSPDPAPQWICGTDVGGGKSYAAQDCAIDLVSELRKQGRQDVVTDWKSTHKLIDEQVKEYQEKAEGRGLKVAVYKGPAAKINPHDPSDDAPRMCKRHKEVEEAQRLGGYISELCNRCEHNPKIGGNCDYLAQQKKRPDIWLGANTVAFQQKLPEAISKNGVGACIFDEGFHGAAIMESVEIRLGEIEDWRTPKEMDDRLELIDMRHRFVSSLRDEPVGYVRREALLKPGCEVGYLPAENALKLEKERRLTAEDELDPLKRKDNASLATARMLWTAVMRLTFPGRALLGDGQSASPRLT